MWGNSMVALRWVVRQTNPCGGALGLPQGAEVRWVVVAGSGGGKREIVLALTGFENCVLASATLPRGDPTARLLPACIGLAPRAGQGWLWPASTVPSSGGNRPASPASPDTAAKAKVS